MHPTEIAYDYYTAQRALEAVDRRPAFGFNLDPSHLYHQGVDAAVFARDFADRIYHTHIKDTFVRRDGRAGILGSYLRFGDARRGWEFRSPGHGQIDFGELIRALNDIGYARAPLGGVGGRRDGPRARGARRRRVLPADRLHRRRAGVRRRASQPTR